MSAGIAKGQVRVLKADLTSELQPGEVLVTEFTDIGWTPFFAYAAAVVVDTGRRCRTRRSSHANSGSLVSLDRSLGAVSYAQATWSRLTAHPGASQGLSEIGDDVPIAQIGLTRGSSTTSIGSSCRRPAGDEAVRRRTRSVCSSDLWAWPCSVSASRASPAARMSSSWIRTTRCGTSRRQPG